MPVPPPLPINTHELSGNQPDLGSRVNSARGTFVDRLSPRVPVDNTDSSINEQRAHQNHSRTVSARTSAESLVDGKPSMSFQQIVKDAPELRLIARRVSLRCDERRYEGLLTFVNKTTVMLADVLLVSDSLKIGESGLSDKSFVTLLPYVTFNRKNIRDVKLVDEPTGIRAIDAPNLMSKDAEISFPLPPSHLFHRNRPYGSSPMLESNKSKATETLKGSIYRDSDSGAPVLPEEILRAHVRRYIVQSELGSSRDPASSLDLVSYLHLRVQNIHEHRSVLWEKEALIVSQMSANPSQLPTLPHKIDLEAIKEEEKAVLQDLAAEIAGHRTGSNRRTQSATAAALRRAYYEARRAERRRQRRTTTNEPVVSPPTPPEIEQTRTRGQLDRCCTSYAGIVHLAIAVTMVFFWFTVRIRAADILRKRFLGQNFSIVVIVACAVTALAGATSIACGCFGSNKKRYLFILPVLVLLLCSVTLTVSTATLRDPIRWNFGIEDAFYAAIAEPETGEVCSFASKNSCSGYRTTCAQEWDPTQCLETCREIMINAANQKNACNVPFRSQALGILIPVVVFCLFALLILSCDCLFIDTGRPQLTQNEPIATADAVTVTQNR